jgi:hypothetical protein
LKNRAYQVTDKQDNTTYSINFNICGKAVDRCAGNVTDFANMVTKTKNKGNESCHHMSGNSDYDQKVFLLDKRFPHYGLKMNYSRGQECPFNKSRDLTLNVQINCDSGAEETKIFLNRTAFQNDKCSPQIVMSSPAGCPVFSMPALSRWIQSYYFIVTLAYFMIGMTLLVFGGKFYMASIATISAVFATVVMLTSMFAHILPGFTPSFLVWIFIVLCCGIGSGAAYGTYHWPRAGIVIISLCTGCILGMTIYSAFMGSYDFVGDKLMIALNG